MGTYYEFRTAAKWPVYKQVRYDQESLPVLGSQSVQTPPARGILVHEGKIPSIHERHLLRGERLDLRLRYIRECPRLAPSPRAQVPPPGGALVYGGGIRRTYDPLVEKPELWLDFANLNAQDINQMVEFAQKHGLLGLDRFEFATPLHGEYVMHWQGEIIRMKAVFEVYLDFLCPETALRPSPSLLADKFKPHPRGSGLVIYVYDRANSPRAWDGSEYEDTELARIGWAWEGFGDLSKPLDLARKVIGDVIERRLYRHITPILDTSHEEPLAVLNIPSLLGAMYMQIWLALASGKLGRMRRCAECGKWFEQDRKGLMYCHKPCDGSMVRMRRYRERKAASSQ